MRTYGTKQKRCFGKMINFVAEFLIWHRGRVARQRSAKPSTAVRIRSVPLSFYVGFAILSHDFAPLLEYRDSFHYFLSNTYDFSRIALY